MGKEIFVAPNQLFSPNGLGANLLIENGKAHMLTDFSKLLKKFPDAQLPTQASPEPRLVLSAEENDLLKLVHRYAHQELSSWSVSTSWDFGELLSQLTMLEMKGVIGQSDP
jgi:predicted Rossmann fold nucleotide-binding protein DprA/Smf involved in DNA uptake